MCSTYFAGFTGCYGQGGAILKQGKCPRCGSEEVYAGLGCCYCKFHMTRRGRHIFNIPEIL